MEFDDHDYEDIPSKTQRKKEAHAQQELGEQLTQMQDSILDELPLGDTLRGAIDEFKRIPPKHGAVKRQLQYIGKLIRDCDTEAIQDAIDALQDNTLRNSPGNQVTDLALQYCEKILREGDAGIQAILEAEPAIERQQIRQLLRNHERASEARKAQTQEKLLAYLREYCG